MVSFVDEGGGITRRQTWSVEKAESLDCLKNGRVIGTLGNYLYYLNL